MWWVSILCIMLVKRIVIAANFVHEKESRKIKCPINVVEWHFSVRTFCVMYDHTLCRLEITWSDHIILNGRLCGYVWVNVLTLARAKKYYLKPCGYVWVNVFTLARAKRKLFKTPPICDCIHINLCVFFDQLVSLCMKMTAKYTNIVNRLCGVVKRH